MLSKEQIEQVLTAAYQPQEWKQMLTHIFQQQRAKVEWLTKPVEVIKDSKASQYRTKSLRQLGTVKLNDDRQLTIFEVEVQNTHIADNRVGLRSLVQNEIVPGFADAALAVFFSTEQQVWRFTFLSKWEYPEESGKIVKHETHPKKYTYVLGPTETCRTAKEQLYLLQQGNGSLQALIDAFSVSKLSKEFFTEYKQHYQQFVEYLVNSKYRKQVFAITKYKSREENEAAEKPIRDFVKRLLGRMVFLYFLQKKGWLKSFWARPGQLMPDASFMKHLWDNTPTRTDFFSSRLVPLFFDTLNKKRKNDLFKADGQTLGEIPYLNGGLFEKDLEGVENLRFDRQLFDNLIFFLNSYNFTIVEDSPDEREVAVDPEMLGHIFENLIEENKKFGTFYTPKEVVHFMTQEALLLHLTKKLQLTEGTDEWLQLQQFIQYKDIGAFIKKKAGVINKEIDDLKICDPAIGSGAFPMGMLLELYQLKRHLYALLDTATPFVPSQVKEQIIKRSIYGVDIDKGAIDIARLRFWLSLIVDLEEPRELPNLDYKLMQGDSLKEGYGDISLKFETVTYGIQVVEPQRDLFGNVVNPQMDIAQFVQSGNYTAELDVEGLEEKLFDSHDLTEKKQIRKDLLKLEKDFIKSRLTERKTELTERIKQLNKKLTDDSKNLNVTQKKAKASAGAKKIAPLQEKLDEVNEQLSHLDLLSAYEKPYFLWHLYFKHVFNAGGFDIVIANPPYGVKVDDLLYAESGLGSKDSYGLFMTLATETLLKPGGTMMYIVSDTWLTIKSHFELRQKMLTHQLHHVVRLHADTFGAVVNTCIVSLSKLPKGTTPAGELIAADLTNLSTRKATPEFREKLWHLRKYIGKYNERYAVYQYPQSLISTNSNLPIFTASPTLFALMNDTTCSKETITLTDVNGLPKDVEARLIQINGQTVKLVRFGDVAATPHGISTGNNKKYVRVEDGYDNSYEAIESWMKAKSSVLSRINHDEKIKGLDIDWRSLQGCFVPFEKGGASDTKEGWLPNYYVPTRYYINWGKGAIKDMAKNPGFRWINVEYFFRKGLSFSISGAYAPTFRINSAGVFEAKGSGIFTETFESEELLAVLCSKLAKFIFKNFIKHTVDTSGEDIANFVILAQIPRAVIELVNQIIHQQKSNEHYQFFENEQKGIDQIVYKAYGLTESDIQEVEYWWARRYPKLARFADTRPQVEPTADAQEQAARLLETIARGENKYCEFKSSLRLDVRKGTPEKYIEHTAFKNITAFMNSEGGTLLIGVDDDKNLLGLEETDYKTFSKADKQDEWSKHFDNLVQTMLGNTFQQFISLSFVPVNGKTLAVVEVKPAGEPAWIRYEGKEELYIRRTASAIALSPKEAAGYVGQRWKK
ncbi:MAG: putative DNA binding domain-containing protein [Chitinophagaceae bacterium]|nr:putative DNA binding domain-containing protein [Chitinophagaceae bacterium]